MGGEECIYAMSTETSEDSSASLLGTCTASTVPDEAVRRCSARMSRYVLQSWQRRTHVLAGTLLGAQVGAWRGGAHRMGRASAHISW